MAETLSSVLMLVGSLFMLLAAVGIIRLPDLFTRMHGSTKSATLGAFFLMVAAAIHFGEASLAVRALLAVLFLFLTAPVAAHVIGRAAYLWEVPLWEGTLSDDLRGKYDLHNQTLQGWTEEEGEGEPPPPAPHGAGRFDSPDPDAP